MSDERRKKVFLMKLWIGLIVGGLLILWLANLRNVWSFNQQIMSAKDKLQWAELKNSWSGAVTDVSNNLDRIKELKETSLEEKQITRPPWLEEVMQEAEKLASSSGVAALISSSTNSSLEVIESTTEAVISE